MLLQIDDTLLPLLLGSLGGLVVGFGLSAVLWRHRRIDKVDAARPPLALPEVAVAVPAPIRPLAADLLLVDDSAVARAKLRRLFEPAGYRVHLATDGIEALGLLAQGRYGLMITDLEMPNMDGVALINACAEQPETAHMPILAITGHDSLAAKFDECGDICGVHRKPWVDDILLSHAATLIGTRREPGRRPVSRVPLSPGRGLAPLVQSASTDTAFVTR